MKKIAPLFLTLALSFNIPNITLAQDIPVDSNKMLSIIEELSSNPRGVKNDEIETSREFIINEFESYGLEVTTQPFESEFIDWNNSSSNEPNIYKGINIISTIYPNTQNKTNDILIIGAHYDTVDNVPGANDNGSGVSVMLELARVLKDLPTDTEIRFVAFDAEETGLNGSQKYIQSLDEKDLNNIIGMLNFDMLAGAKQQMVKIGSVDGEANYLYDILKDTDYFDVDLRAENRSDHAHFFSMLIPSLTFTHEVIRGEYHSEGDIVENISTDMLQDVANCALEIIKEIANEETASYQSIVKPKQDDTIYQITNTTYIPAFGTKKEIEKVSSIKFTQIPSNERDAKLMAKVKLFDIEEIFTLTARGSNYLSNMYIDLKNSNISFEELYKVLTKEFGEPTQPEYSTNWYIWNSIYGNSYYITFSSYDNGESFFELGIREYESDTDREGYSLINGELVRMEEGSEYNSTSVTRQDSEIVVEHKINKPSDTLPVTDTAKKVWEKVKPFFTEDELNKISFISIYTNGIGVRPAIIMSYYEQDSEFSLEDLIARMIKDMEKEESLSGSTMAYPISGVTILIDYLDILNELGNAYSEEDFLKSIAIARAGFYGSPSAPSMWAIESVVKAIEADIVPSNLQSDYTSNITKEEFGQLVFELLKLLNITASDNIFNFNIQENITREEACIILNKVCELMKLKVKPSKYVFADDMEISDYAKEAVYNMKSLGIISSMENNIFAPKDKLTREQAIITIVKLFEKFNK